MQVLQKKGMLKIIGRHEQHVKDNDGGVSIFSMDTLWRLLECPLCKGILLHKSYSDDSMFDPYNNEYFSDESIVYLSSKYTFKHVPENIYKSYETAVKNSKDDLTICLIAIRALLEKICRERGSKKKNLEAMLKEISTYKFKV